MTILDIIAKKRDGFPLTSAEIGFFVGTYTRGEIADYQASALLMAIYLRGMDGAETASLTTAMADSGRRIDLTAHLPEGTPTLDKHSTGGVGDKTSLVVVPILAALGIAVCKMSGRGLGHTGGTLDKLEAIPGFRVNLTPEEMVAQVARIGACLAGQTGDLAPADKKLYALRDATATVSSLPLIVSSILSKKLAGGASSFLFDVKAGSGALMKTLPEAEALAEALVTSARQSGRRALAVLSDMSQPLGTTVGNALEVAEAIRTLTPPGGANDAERPVDGRFLSLCIRLAVAGVLLAGLEADPETARARVEGALASGAALRVFGEIVAAQGGDPRIIDTPDRILPHAPYIVPVLAPESGFVASLDAETIGRIVVGLGGGRTRKDDSIDPAVGIVIHATVGDAVAAGDRLAEVHARTAPEATAAANRVADIYGLHPMFTAVPDVVITG